MLRPTLGTSCAAILVVACGLCLLQLMFAIGRWPHSSHLVSACAFRCGVPSLRWCLHCFLEVLRGLLLCIHPDASIAEHAWMIFIFYCVSLSPEVHVTETAG